MSGSTDPIGRSILKRGFVAGRVLTRRQRCFRPVTQPGQWRFQVMAILSDTCFRPSFRSAIFASIWFRLPERRSNSSPEPVTGNRPVRSPAMIRWLAKDTPSIRRNAMPANEIPYQQCAQSHHGKCKGQRPLNNLPETFGSPRSRPTRIRIWLGNTKTCASA